MTKNTHLLAGLVGFLIVFLMAIQFGSAQQRAQNAPKWEYKVVSLGSMAEESAERWTDDLNGFADHGWEVVQTMELTYVGKLRVFLKRQKP